MRTRASSEVRTEAFGALRQELIESLGILSTPAAKLIEELRYAIKALSNSSVNGFISK